MFLYRFRMPYGSKSGSAILIRDAVKRLPMLKPSLAAFTVLLAAVALLASASPYTVSVSTSKSEYAPGDTVTVNVKIDSSATVVLMWEVYDPNGARRDFGQLTCSGSCSFSFRTGSNWPTGTYRIVVAVSGTGDRGYAQFTLRTPTAPGGGAGAAPPPPTDYKSLAGSRIAAVSTALADLNATLRTLIDLLKLLNQTLSQDYLAQLSEAAGLLNKARDLYNSANYESAYNTAVSASQMLGSLSASVVNEAARALTSVAEKLKAGAQDNVTAELLKGVSESLATITPNDREALGKLISAARILVVIARALKAPQLEASVAALAQQAAQLQSSLENLTKTATELQAQLETVQREKGELASRVETLQGSLSSLTSENEQLKQQVRSLSEENAQLKAQLEQSVPRSFAVTAAAAAAAAGLAAGAAIGAIAAKKRATGKP
jgi:regulator of replication initiation timing